MTTEKCLQIKIQNYTTKMKPRVSAASQGECLHDSNKTSTLAARGRKGWEGKASESLELTQVIQCKRETQIRRGGQRARLRLCRWSALGYLGVLF